MLTFWRFTIAFSAVIASSIIFFYLVKISIYDIQFNDNLPPKGIKDIPPSDTIIPNIFAQIPLSSLPKQITPAPVSNRIYSNVDSSSQVLSPQQCLDYAKNCRDVQCAFQDFKVNCNNHRNGPTCTCGSGQTSGAFSIQPNTHFILLSLFISFVIYFNFG